MSENTTKKMNKKDLFDKLNELEAEYKSKLEESSPKKLQLQKMEYSAPTDDEIATLAKSSLEQKYGTLKENAKEKKESQKSSFSSAIENAMKQAESEQEKINSGYDSSKKELENQAIKRGVQRSSVIMNELGELEKEKLQSVKAVDDEKNLKVEKLNGEISELETQLADSLKELDMQKAFDLNEKISELKTERAKKQEEVLKYNNEIEEKQVKAGNEFNKQNENSVEKQQAFELSTKKLGTVLDYYLAYDDPKQALEDFLAEDELPSYLGDFYNYVYNALSVR